MGAQQCRPIVRLGSKAALGSQHALGRYSLGNGHGRAQGWGQPRANCRSLRLVQSFALQHEIL